MTRLIMVRHGETEWNAARRLQGATDIPLNDRGREQARRVADRLLTHDLGADPILVSSDLSRAQETAQIIAKTLGSSQLRTYRGLRERSYGVAEGLTDAEYRERYGAFNRDNVPGAETDLQLRLRALRAVRRVTREARGERAPLDPVIVAASHGGLIAQLIRHATGGALPLPEERLANASVHVFRMERDHLSLLSYEAVPIGVR